LQTLVCRVMQLGLPPLRPPGPYSQWTYTGQHLSQPQYLIGVSFISFFSYVKDILLLQRIPKTKSPAHVPKRGAKSRRHQRNPNKLGHRESLRVFCFSRSLSIARCCWCFAVRKCLAPLFHRLFHRLFGTGQRNLPIYRLRLSLSPLNLSLDFFL
jgi:hypothetical protein